MKSTRATYDTSYQTLAFLPLLLEGCRQALLEKRHSIRRKNRTLSSGFLNFKIAHRKYKSDFQLAASYGCLAVQNLFALGPNFYSYRTRWINMCLLPSTFHLLPSLLFPFFKRSTYISATLDIME